MVASMKAKGAPVDGSTRSSVAMTVLIPCSEKLLAWTFTIFTAEMFKSST
jgi:hypothetical protein